MIKIKPLAQVIKEGKEKDESPDAIYVASEINLLDKADKNTEEAGKDSKEIEKQRGELAKRYKEITGHDDITKSIPESVMEADEAMALHEGLLQDLNIKSWADFGRKYSAQIKNLVSEVGGNFVGYTYDPPTQTIAIVTDKGIGKYYFNADSNEFDQYQVQPFYK